MYGIIGSSQIRINAAMSRFATPGEASFSAKAKQKFPQGGCWKLESSSEHGAGLSWVYLSAAGFWCVSGSCVLHGGSEAPFSIPALCGVFRASLDGSLCSGFTHMGDLAHFQCPSHFCASPFSMSKFSSFLDFSRVYLDFFVVLRFYYVGTQVLHLPKAKLSLFISFWKKKKLLNCVH